MLEHYLEKTVNYLYPYIYFSVQKIYKLGYTNDYVANFRRIKLPPLKWNHSS